MTGIGLERVSFRYGDGPDVLRGMDLTLDPGVTALAGTNGAGKSTLLRLCNGLLHPTGGRVLVDGTDTRTATVATLARTVGLVFQHPSDQLFRSRLLDEATVGPLNLGCTPGEARRRARAALEDVGLEGRAEANPYDLGLADRKLAAIASVLAMEPAVVLLDEPTLGQDRASTDRIGELVGRLGKCGRTVVVVTHDMGFVARWCQRTLVLGGGRVMVDDATRSVFDEEPVLREAGLELPVVTRLGRALRMGETILTIDEFVTAARRRGLAGRQA